MVLFANHVNIAQGIGDPYRKKSQIPLPNERTIDIEFLDPCIVAVNDIEVATAVDRNTIDPAKVAGVGATNLLDRRRRRYRCHGRPDGFCLRRQIGCPRGTAVCDRHQQHRGDGDD